MSARVLIFGATSTIAGDVARVYARRGARLYLVGRNAEKLAALAAELGDAAVIGTAAADFTDTAGAAALVAAALSTAGDVDVAVVAHGLLGDQLATERDFAAAARVIDTNFVSVVALLIPLANHFEGRGAGHLAVLSSVAGERGRPRNYTYGAAKGALNVYLQGVRSRLSPRGIGVHTLKLGPVDTPMTVDHRKTLLFARAPAVAAAIVRAIDGNRAEAYVPWFWRIIMAVVRWIPEPLFRRIGALSGR